MRSKIRIEEGAKIILFLILLMQLYFTNGVYLFVCTLCFYFILFYLQQPYKSSVFTLIFIYHFLQIITGVLLSTYLGNDINYPTPNMGTATYLSLIGLICMFIPIIYFQNKLPVINLAIFKKHAFQLSINRSFYVYVIVFFVSGVLGRLRFSYAGYSQIIVSLLSVKWCFFLIFGFQCILKNAKKSQFYFFIGLEFILGFASFFSDFKTVIFYVIVLYITFLVTLTTKRLLISMFFGVIIFLGALFWTSVKTEYRMFLNKGTASQSVQVSRDEALNKLYELSNKSNNQYNSSISTLLDRLQATQNFALTIGRVPAIIPYQNGKNWSETFQFVLTPRLFNPNKPTVDFSKKVAEYTGIGHAGLLAGTSFSLGYFVDCYIDFGMYGMMIPLFLIGLFYGYTHFYFIKNSSRNILFNYSVAGALFMEFFALEMDNTYLLGRLFAAVLTFLLLRKLFFPWLIRYLSVPDAK